MFKKEVENNLNLVLLTPNHADELFELVENNREHLTKWMTWPPETTSSKDTGEFIRKSLVGLSNLEEIYFGIELNNKLVGVIAFNTISKKLRKVIIGYWISEDFQGKGIITKCCQFLINYAFDELDMDKIEIHIATENYPSQRVCERLGFKQEGTVHNAENLHGNIVNYNYYALFKRT